MSTSIAGFAHELRDVVVIMTLEFGVCLVVAGRDNVTHDDVGPLQVSWVVLIAKEMGRGIEVAYCLVHH